MKALSKIALLSSFAAVLFAVSCKPDDSPQATPSDPRDVYVAAWTCNEHSTQIGTTSYTVHINKSTTNSAQVFITNFYNTGTGQATANISGNSITISQQTFNGNQLHGSGTKTGDNSISLTYYMNNGSSIDTCTSTLTRQ